MNAPVRLTMLRHNSPTGKTYPAVYDTHLGTLAVVGKRITDPRLLGQLGIAEGETVVEIPVTLLPEVAPDA
ncbi:MAG: hypothetical protein ACRDN9_06630 [Streptosporangiaceae bacterium]